MKVVIFLISFFLPLVLNAQNCDNELPSGNWTSTSITPSGNGSYTLSDLSAGFFRRMGIHYGMEASINIDCQGRVEASSFISDFGECEILSGAWDSVNNTLSVTWKIPMNNFYETVVFELN